MNKNLIEKYLIKMINKYYHIVIVNRKYLIIFILYRYYNNNKNYNHKNGNHYVRHFHMIIIIHHYKENNNKKESNNKINSFIEIDLKKYLLNKVYPNINKKNHIHKKNINQLLHIKNKYNKKIKKKSYKLYKQEIWKNQHINFNNKNKNKELIKLIKLNIHINKIKKYMILHKKHNKKELNKEINL